MYIFLYVSDLFSLACKNAKRDGDPKKAIPLQVAGARGR
jgi:hypothetical protein